MICTGSKPHDKSCSKPLWQVHLNSHSFDKSHTHLCLLHMSLDLFWRYVLLSGFYVAHLMVCLIVSLCCKLAADLRSKGTLGSSGMGQAVKGVFRQRALFPWTTVVQAMGEKEGHLFVSLHQALQYSIQTEDLLKGLQHGWTNPRHYLLCF